MPPPDSPPSSVSPLSEEAIAELEEKLAEVQRCGDRLARLKSPAGWADYNQELSAGEAATRAHAAFEHALIEAGPSLLAEVVAGRKELARWRDGRKYRGGPGTVLREVENERDAALRERDEARAEAARLQTAIDNTPELRIGIDERDAAICERDEAIALLHSHHAAHRDGQASSGCSCDDGEPCGLARGIASLASAALSAEVK